MSPATAASLARPFSGGAFTFTLSASASAPTTSSRDDPGTTFRLKRPMRSTAPSGEPVLHHHLGQGQLAALRHGGFHCLADGDHEADHVVAWEVDGVKRVHVNCIPHVRESKPMPLYEYSCEKCSRKNELHH